MKTIFSKQAPAPIGPYSQAVACGGFLFLSGQIGLDPASGKLVDGGMEAQTRQVMHNLEAVLRAADLRFEDLIKVDVFLTDMEQFASFNRVYAEALGEGAKPARQVVEVRRLPLGAEVEVSAIASLNRPDP